MHPLLIALLIVLIVVRAVCIGLAVAICVRPPHTVVGPVLGVTKSHVKSRIPGLGHAVVEYTRKGRPYTGTTRALPPKLLPKVGAKQTFLLCLTDDGCGNKRYWLDAGRRPPARAPR